MLFFAVTQVTNNISVPGHDAGAEQETEAELVRSEPKTGASIMKTQTDITMIALATLCIAANLFLGGLVLIDSAEHGP